MSDAQGIPVEKRILRYWTDVLSRPNWSEMVNRQPLATCRTLHELEQVTLDLDVLTQDATNKTAVVHIVAVDGGRKRALFAIAAEVAEGGQLAPPHEAAMLLLNPDFFAHDEALLSQDTIGLADSFFKASASVPTTSWQAYIDGFERAFESCGVDIETPKINHGRAQKVQWWIIPRQDKPDGTVYNIVRRYENLLKQPLDRWPVVFRRLLQQAAENQPVTSVSTVIAHVDAARDESREVWPLDPTQRFAAASALDLIEGQVLTVHGPPGTGKTTFLRSLISSLWVKPLLDGDIHAVFPPIIMGAAPTNASSANMIGTFDNALPAETTAERMDCRFVPGHQTYGWYFPATSKVESSSRPLLVYKDKRLVYEHAGDHLQQLTQVGTGDKESVRRELESQYIDNASRVLKRSFVSLREAMDALATELRRVHALSVRHDDMLQEWISMCPGDALDGANDGGGVEKDTHHRKPAWLLWILRFILRIRRKHDAEAHVKDSAPAHPEVRARRFLERALSAEIPDWWQILIDTSKLETARRRLMDHATQPCEAWEETARRLWNEYAEIAYKPAVFHVAARVWEGRWLEVMQNDTNARSLDDELRIASMIAPFVVATIHRLPTLANHPRMKAGAFADLVILDEAGQASVELAAASISCGKRVVAVGDGKQLEPVRSVEKSEDDILHRLYGIEGIHETLTISGGHALAALSACSIYPKEDGMSGVQLLYHYRCLEPIIQYCNHLCYEGKLVPSRPAPKKPLPWPPISYVLTDKTYRQEAAEADNLNGWRNRGQAKEIAAWLAEEQESLERAYGIPLAEIVAVITPYKPQTEVLHQELTKSLGKNVTGKMIIGTVNALQGMERPVVIFSSVVTRERRSVWLDGNVNLLNVAVSRARDSFVVFGDKGVLFETPADTPLARLGRHIDRYGQMLYPKELVVVEAPGKRQKIQQALGRRRLVVATGGHIRDLPDMNVDVDWRTPPWRVKDESRLVVERLQEYARALGTVVLATDDDREGEAIAWHVLDELTKRGVPLTAENVKRMRFSSLAPETLRQSYERAGPGLDINRVRAALARDIADYLIGKRYSETLGVSMGRVKSALLLLVAQRCRQEPMHRIVVKLLTEDQGFVTGYVVENRTSVAKPLLVTGDDDERFRRLKEDLMWADVDDMGIRRILREGRNLEAPTTMDMLKVLAQHQITPWDAMSALQELYEGEPR
ncbi:MAG: hypothetical protein K6T83_00135 [Alicyclobacillus sp.]|nr:hypothetical protein [Alicyclobacillus sp.]